MYSVPRNIISITCRYVGKVCAFVLIVALVDNDIKMIQDYDGYVMAHADRDIVRRFSSDRVVTSLYELIDILLAPA